MAAILIDAIRAHGGEICDSSDRWKNPLFRELYHSYRSHACQNHHWSLFEILANLEPMARWLRREGWCAYHWRQKEWKTDKFCFCPEGLVFSSLCPQLTAWLLANT
jgi:hypothetical protein